MPDDEEEAYLVDDDDNDIEADGDICDRCECPRENHEDGIGECKCKRCRRFKEPS
jgi:hypothetical protein